MSTSRTAQVLAQWDEWSSRCTDRLFELDARVSAQGSDADRLDIAAVFVARKAIVERIEAMRAASRTDERAASALAGQRLADEHGELVANDLPAAATLVDAILGRIEQHLVESDAREAGVVAAMAAVGTALAHAEVLVETLGSHAKQLAELRTEQVAAGRDHDALIGLAGAAERLLLQLRVAERERTDVLGALPAVPGRLASLRERELAVRALVDDVRTKVAPVPNAAVPAVDALGPVPETADLPWPAARDRLVPYLTRLDRLAAALDEVERRFRACLEQRSELRGLLQAYRDKAGERRLAEDPRLESRYRAARELLWSAPCDLAGAAPLVATYTEAVNALIAGKDIGRPDTASDRAGDTAPAGEER